MHSKLLLESKAQTWNKLAQEITAELSFYKLWQVQMRRNDKFEVQININTRDEDSNVLKIDEQKGIVFSKNTSNKQIRVVLKSI